MVNREVDSTPPDPRCPIASLAAIPPDAANPKLAQQWLVAGQDHEAMMIAPFADDVGQEFSKAGGARPAGAG